MLTVSYLLKLTIFGGENNDNVYSSEVVKKTKKTVLMHIASRRQIWQLFTLNKECGASFRKYFADADEDFYKISCSGKVNLRSINNGQKNIVGHIVDETKNTLKVQF